MSKKNPTGYESVVTYLSEDLVYELLREGIRVKKLILKGGLGDWLLIITARVEGEAKVAFMGSGSIEGVARKVHKQCLEGEIEWKEDKFAK